MGIQPNQEAVPFTQTASDKLDSVAPNAAPAPTIADQAEAQAGIDNSTMMTPLRVAQAITAQVGNTGASYTESLLNTSGQTLNALTPVKQNTSSHISKIDVSIESDVMNIIGLLTVTTVNNTAGAVLLNGFLQNISTGFNVADVLYVDTNGNLTNIVPNIGSNGFSRGDFVVKMGRILQNINNPSNQDFKLEMSVIGQL